MKSFSEYRKQILEEVEDNKKREENYKKLKSLCSKYNAFYIDYAYAHELSNHKEELFLSLNSTIGGSSTPKIKLEAINHFHRTDDKTHRLILSGSLNDEQTSWDNLKNYLNNFYNFAQGLKNFDCHLLPKEK